MYTPSLRSEIDRFKDVINFQRISEINREYYENDVTIQYLITYLRSEEFSKAANIFMQSDEVDDISEWIKYHGVDFKAHVVDFDEAISGAHRAASASLQTSVFSQFSYKTFEDEISNEIDYAGVNALITTLLSEGNDFAHLYLILNVSRPALENTFKHEEIQIVLGKLVELGVNIDYIKTVIYEILRWK